jgi:hypothetical protein
VLLGERADAVIEQARDLAWRTAERVTAAPAATAPCSHRQRTDAAAQPSTRDVIDRVLEIDHHLARSARHDGCSAG